MKKGDLVRTIFTPPTLRDHGRLFVIVDPREEFYDAVMAKSLITGAVKLLRRANLTEANHEEG